MEIKDLVYPKLSYEIIGIAFKVFNSLGHGLSEKSYQQAFAAELSLNKINFQREVFAKINYLDQSIGKYFLDFVINGKIIVELKVRPRLGYINAKQVLSYLKVTGHRLAILIYFTHEGIKYRRILNPLAGD